ncbi:MAG: AIR synthase-related protein, partial [Rubrivivax sp.]|nr:AIR synthase-related protein [Rubrivivax sp.]
PLNLCITVLGEVPAGQALRRAGARPGDAIWVSGTLGDARLGLEVLRGTVSLEGVAFEQVRRAMELPTPRVALGQALRGLAHSAIDISDGLVGDLGHVLQASGVGATLQADAMPRSRVLSHLPEPLQWTCTLYGGDDYELLFTAGAAQSDAVLAAAARAGVPVTRIGTIDAGPGLRVVDGHGRAQNLAAHGFDHFAP